MSDWQPIETAPKVSDWMRQKPYAKFLLGRFYKIHDEDGAEIDEWHLSWIQAASLASDGWRLGTDGFTGMHGFASFALRGDATHWMPISSSPATGATHER